MGSDKRLAYAFAASVLFNGACVAMVGSASLHHSRLPRTHDTSELHPAPLQMAVATPAPSGGREADGKSGDGASGPDAGTGKPGDSRTAPTEKGAGKSEGRTAKSQAEAVRDEESPAAAEKRLEEQLKSGRPLTVSQKKRLAHEMLALAELRPSVPSAAASLHALVAANKSVSSSRTGIPPKGMSVVTRPIIPGKNGHVGDRGNSVSPKMVKYPKAKLDLGTIHMTRPTHGVTGGGSADLRNVDIKVHYVVDDPNNKPKHLLADKIIKRFPTNCNGDPGNTSKCLATGGNTRLGGTTLHGRHDQITGVKYCVPGGGGIPSAGSNGSQSGRSSSGKTSSAKSSSDGRQASTGKGSLRRGRYAPTMADLPADPGTLLHLPENHGDFHLLVPGAKVPEADRKWVDNPEAHTDAAPPGVKLAALPRFSVSPRTVGSLSKFGTLNWGKPLKIRHKKAPYGGDGTGLLGTYYLGEDFNQLVFTRPDRNIDFDWTGSPPDPRIAPGLVYSVRWLGKLVPKVSDTYTLMTDSDDGVRVYLDGKLLISRWSIHFESEDLTTVRLEAEHEYEIKLEYFENGLGPAAMKLYWEAPGVPREYVPESCLRYPLVRVAQ
jgi:hypothetical protein